MNQQERENFRNCSILRKNGIIHHKMSHTGNNDICLSPKDFCDAVNGRVHHLTSIETERKRYINLNTIAKAYENNSLIYQEKMNHSTRKTFVVIYNVKSMFDVYSSLPY